MGPCAEEECLRVRIRPGGGGSAFAQQHPDYSAFRFACLPMDLKASSSLLEHLLFEASLDGGVCLMAELAALLEAAGLTCKECRVKLEVVGPIGISTESKAPVVCEPSRDGCGLTTSEPTQHESLAKPGRAKAEFDEPTALEPTEMGKTVRPTEPSETVSTQAVVRVAPAKASDVDEAAQALEPTEIGKAFCSSETTNESAGDAKAFLVTEHTSEDGLLVSQAPVHVIALTQARR